MQARKKWMGGNSRSKYCSGKEKVSSREKGKFDDVVLIDVDGDQLDDVVVIDGDSPEGNLHGCGELKEEKRFPFEGIINIDDDEDISEGNPGVHWGTEVGGDTSPTKSCSTSNRPWRSVGLDDDDCQVIHERKSAFGLSKCKQAEFGKPPSEKGYGFSPGSTCSSKENDFSDCVVIEGLAENPHPKWEKASKRRKYNVNGSQLGRGDQKGAFESPSNTPPNFEARNGTEQCTEAPVCSSSGESTFSETCSSATPEVTSEKVFDEGKPVPFDSSQSNETLYKRSFSREAEEPILDSISNRKQCDGDPDHLHGDDTARYQREAFIDREKLKETDKYQRAAEAEWASRKQALQLQAEEAQRLRKKRKAERQQMKEMRNVESNVIIDEKVHNQSKPVCSENAKAKETPVEQSFSTQVEEPLINSMGDGTECEQRDPHSVKFDGNATPSQNIIDREKLKDSEEYKQAAEAEWIARQREIKLQAQEAQRLRRKKQAENMRILDMERRQKQRVEEMREIQKQDEENMNLKEQLRIEVRRELSILESSCTDMASLLHSLGIHLARDSNLSTHEVHAAYKRALLRFHPDRASRTDIRQQVEAEEKFKLISRMKEKYLSASCH